MLKKTKFFYLMGTMALIMGSISVSVGAFSTHIDSMIFGIMAASLITSIISFILASFFSFQINEAEKKQKDKVIVLVSLNIIIVGLVHLLYFYTGYDLKNEELSAQYNIFLLWATPVGLILLGLLLPSRH
jgi:small-conductance mechanosensitive channel